MIKASITYLVSGIISRSVPLLLLPLLTAYLDPADFGRLALTQLMLQCTTAIFGLSLATNITRRFYKGDSADLSILIFNLLLVAICSCLLALILFGFVSLNINELFGVSTYWLYMLPVYAFCATSLSLYLTLLRAREMPRRFALFEIVTACVNIAVTILLVVGMKYGWEGRVVAIVFAVIGGGAIALFSLFRKGDIKPVLNVSAIRRSLSISVPLIPHALAGLVMSMIDRAFIERMVGLEDVGIYSVGYSLGVVVMLLSNSFANAWTPWFYKNVATDRKREIVALTYAFIPAFLMVVVIYSIVAMTVLPWVVSDSYIGAVEYVPWICAAYFFFGIYQMHFPYLVHTGRTRLITTTTLVAAVVNIVANYVLIDLYGTIGAAYATVLAYMLSAILITIFARRVMEMPWRMGLQDIWLTLRR